MGIYRAYRDWGYIGIMEIKWKLWGLCGLFRGYVGVIWG